MIEFNLKKGINKGQVVMAYFFVNLISLCFSVQFKVMSELLTNMHHYLEIAEHFYQARKFSA